MFGAEWQRRYTPLTYVTTRRDRWAVISLGLNKLDPDDLRSRIRQFLADDGASDCCARAEERYLTGRSDTRKHPCQDYIGHQHPLWMFERDINRFGHRHLAARAS
jgi:hypothetical protein